MSLLTPSQFAKKHNVDKATVYRWIEGRKVAVTWKTKRVPMIDESATPSHKVKAV